MERICAFPSKIHNLCRLNPTSAQVRKVILFDIVIGVVLLLIGCTSLPLLSALAVTLLGMILAMYPLIRLVTIRLQYQPISFEILADDKVFAVIIPELDIAGFRRRQQSIAALESNITLEHSPSLHCVRLEAAFVTSVFNMNSRLLSRKAHRHSYYFYLEAQDEYPILSLLEALLSVKARNMDT